jgi:HAD superfamily hydrolase (TIGR01509 family)
MQAATAKSMPSVSRSQELLGDSAGLVWDMDGTLINSATVVPDSFIATVEALGGPAASRDEVVALYSLGQPAVMLAHMLGRRASQADIDLYHSELTQRASAAVAYPGVQEALSRLQGALPMAVFTGASRKAAEILLEATRLRPYFSVVIGGDQVTNPKPAPDGIIRASRELGLSPAVCAYIGDAPTDLEAARRSGARALAAGWGHLFREETTMGELIVRSPTDLCPNCRSSTAWEQEHHGE